jgi:cysteine-rich repeat protein/predicted outer membrane repeat protein
MICIGDPMRRFGVVSSTLALALALALALVASTAGCLTDFTGPGTNDNIPPGCGNGVQEGGELCDASDFGGQTCQTALGMDFGNLQCTETCLLDLSGCHNCGNGVLDAGEDCDDFNRSSVDGCSDQCQVESGWICMGEPSLCSTVCGDGITAGVEECDDGNTDVDDGCNPACNTDPGWVCSGEPSVCNETCGNGVLDDAEGCDDGDLISADGCSDNCLVESSWQCSGAPSVCDGVCADGLVVGSETCDDGNSAAGDGCSSDCTVEVGWTCDYTSDPPAGCTPVCGDGIVLENEACDDGNTTSGDGCDQDCTVEPHSACDGEPSVCICVVYVDRDATGGANNGEDWSSAYVQLPDALQVVNWWPACEVWVAEGVFYTYESGTGDRLEVGNDVTMYGGFAGDETWRSQRDFATRVTVLSGEQENNPTHRVRRILNMDGAHGALVDGFTVSGAYSTGYDGGGANIKSTGVTLRNCIFQDNTARNGGGVYIRDGSATISDCVFVDNVADDNGGGITLDNNGVLLVERCLFDGNYSDNRGGAISFDNADSLTVDRCRFTQNTAQDYGGAIRAAGGGGDLDIMNSVFWQNSADLGGGGMSVFQLWSTVTLTSCTFHDNSANPGQGSSLSVGDGDVMAQNTIFWGGTTDQIDEDFGGDVSLAYCDVFGGASGNGVINSDPAFVAPLTGDLRLSSSSPCIDAGDGDQAPLTDMDDNPRVDIAATPNTGSGIPAYVDMGAYEVQ